MDDPGHASGWRGAQSSTTCAHCGSFVPSGSSRCPNCHQPASAEDDALTIAGGLDPLTPTPPPPAPSGAVDGDVTHIAAPIDEAATIAIPVRREAPDEALTIAVPPSLDVEARTIAAPPESDYALTIAVVADSPADAMTVSTPVSPAAGHASHAARVRRSSSSDEGPLEVGQSFGPRYHIIRLLGAGGMGAVYQAWDAELGVAVAIKVIRPEVMEDPVTGAEMARRFKRELLLARQVTHKSVVRIHDLGDIDGIKYITMSYVDGTDLSSILKRDGKQPVDKVLRIARAVISGLVAAHTAGVVHRDLKPANIMLDKEGNALIMDFGIAHSTADASAAAEAAPGELPESLRRAATQTHATVVGAIVGTLEYMAPEQAKGQQIDQRADVYAFGLILYDILLGRRRAASGQSAVEELQRRMTSPPPPLQALEPDLPAPLAALVGRCVEPDADKRFQTSADVAAELDRLDDAGQLIPIKKTIGLLQMAAIVALLTVVFGGAWWYFREPPVVVRDNIGVLIADLDNQTGDPGFTRTLEPQVKRALDGASFVTSYDRNRLGGLGEKPPDRFDEKAANEVAARQGIPVLLSGFIARQGSNRYRVSLKATRTVGGEEIATEEGTAGTADVVAVLTRLVGRIRTALGDDTSESSEQFGMGSLTAASLTVVQLYARALEAASNGNHEESKQKALEAVTSDPNFGIGYLVLASASRNLGNPADSEKYIKEAMKHLDGMTERERMSTRGYASWVAGDYQECRTQYSTLLNRFPGDVGGHNQLALCLSHLRDMRKATEEMRVVVKMLPNRVIFRANLALYSSYAGEFAAAESEVRQVAKPDEYLLIALAFSQIGRDRLAEARTTYERLAAVSPVGASYAASGLGDLAAYEGRYGDAITILQRGAAEDLAAKRVDRAAAKFAAIGFAELSRGRPGPAREAAREALKHSNAVKIRFLAGRTLAEADDPKTARTLMQDLAKELSPEAQAHAKIIEGILALKGGDARGAMVLFDAANQTFPTWIGQFELGRAALAAGALTKADSALDDALKRKGEGLSLFVDEEPTAAYVPLAYYYQGRVREEVPTAGFRNSYRQYVQVRGKSPDDALLPDARRRAQEP